jgi:autotransporter-associated beta strand protein
MVEMAATYADPVEKGRPGTGGSSTLTKAMTSKALTTTALTALAAASLLVTARADITTSMVGYWTFADGPGSASAADASGNANNGTLTGFTDATHTSMWTTAVDPFNTWPYALLFNQGTETTDYISVPDSTSLDSITATTKKFTLAAWVKLSAAPGANGAAILCKGNGGNGEAWCLDVYQSKFRVFVRSSSSSTMNVSSTFNAAVGTWYHVVGTYDSGASANKEILYINGVANANSGSGTTATILANTHVLSIGNRQSGSTTYNIPFPGTIDEVRIYNRALSASDVLQLYNNKAFPVINNGVGSWNGLAGSGGNATLDTTSLNFCTNLYTAPLGTADSLADLLNVEQAGALPPNCAFADFFFSNKTTVAVTSTNLTIPTGGVALGTASAAGTMTFLNVVDTYILNSSDDIGLKDGTFPTSLVQSGNGTLILTGTNTFSGGLTVNSGTVQLGNGGAVSGQEVGRATTVTDNGALVFNGSNSITFTNTIAGTGSVVQRGSGTMLMLSNANTYSGGTTLSNSTVPVAVIGDVGSGTLGTGPVTLNGATLLYSGTGETTARQFNGTGGTTNTIDVPASVTLTLNGTLTGSAKWTVNKTGSGTLIVGGSANNAYFGMNINGGTVVLDKTGPTGNAIGSTTTVGAGAMLQLGNNGYVGQFYSGNTTPVTISSGGLLDLNGQTATNYSLTLSGAGAGGGAVITMSPAPPPCSPPRLHWRLTPRSAAAAILHCPASLAAAGCLSLMPARASWPWVASVPIAAGRLSTPAPSRPAPPTASRGASPSAEPVSSGLTVPSPCLPLLL